MGALSLTACATPQGPVMSAQAFESRYPPSSTLLGPGDKLKLSLYGDDALSGEYQVASDGTVSLPLVGALPAAGKDVPAFAKSVETALANGFYTTPKVSVQLASVRPIYVLGEVNQPGSFPYVPDLTLAKAAALAGGYTYRAKIGTIAIRRTGMEQEVVVDATQAMPLAPGDTVRILERFF
ncbi:polysaccharide biosynthesis/export family protein [Sphingobium algorifonticola]|nr:polysaccharide biosynthesis/export family protein [Sphingobium algorifonticola]